MSTGATGWDVDSVTESYTDSVLWPDPKRGPWRVRCTWSNVGGYARLTAIGIESLVVRKGRSATVEPITARVYRSVNPGEVGELVLQKIRQWPNFDLGADEDVVGSHAAGGRTGRPRGTTAVTTDDVVAIYRRHVREGGTSPTKAVAEELNMSRTAAAKRVARAREAGLLEQTTQGTAVPVVKKVSKRSVAKRPAKRKGAR